MVCGSTQARDQTCAKAVTQTNSVAPQGNSIGGFFLFFFFFFFSSSFFGVMCLFLRNLLRLDPQVYCYSHFGDLRIDHSASHIFITPFLNLCKLIV